MKQWKAGLLLVLLVVMVGGIGLAADRLVSGWHPSTIAGPPAKNTVSEATTVTAEVDKGAPLKKLAPNFTLTNQFGKSVSLSQYRGRVVVLSFIDSKCTTVCPLTAVVLKNVRQDLGRYRNDVQLVAVNANPVATRVADVRSWSETHHMLHQWEFLTGSPSALKAVWKKYYVYSQVLKNNQIEHVPEVMVIGPHGHERWLYLNSSDNRVGVIAAEVREVMTHVIPLLPGHPGLRGFPHARQLTYLPGTEGPSGTRGFSASAIEPNGHLSSVSVGNGQKAVLLDFFATWCPDCQEEIPVLKAYEKAAKRQHLPLVLGVDLRLSESSTTHVEKYVRSVHLPYPVALDKSGSISAAYGVSGIPTEILVSGTGRILWYHQGLLGQSALKTAVKAHLKQ